MKKLRVIIMNRSQLKIIVFSLVTVMLASCSGYNQLLKSEDHELMYNAALDFFKDEKYQKTIRVFDEITHIYAGTQREDTICYYYATANYKIANIETSGALFNDFRRRFGRSPFIEDAEYMYAKGFYFLSPEPTRDQTITFEAISAINYYLDRYPNSVKKEALLENIEELTQKLHDKTFLNAKTYYNIGRYKSAVIALKNASREYPESTHSEELFYLVTKSNYLYASNSYDIHKRERYLDMMDAYYTFVSSYPESKYRKELDKMMETAKKYMAQFKEDNNRSTSDTETTI